MSRLPLIGLLKCHHPTEPAEQKMLEDMIRFVEDHPDCFERSLLEGHMTGAAWIVNPERTHALLMHHYKLDKWLQPGGHCDGDPDVMRVAIQEVEEETGLVVVPAAMGIFDVDIHDIPARGMIPEHLHYDVRFILEAKKEGESLPHNHESHEVRWIRLDEIARYTESESILRMVRKTIATIW